MAAIYETTGVGEITVTFPDGGQPCPGAPGRWGYTLPHGFVVDVVEQVGDGGGSIIVTVTTLTPGTKRVEVEACHDDPADETRGYAIERAAVRLYIGDDGV